MPLAMFLPATLLHPPTCMCARFMACDSAAFCALRSRSALVLTNTS